MTATASALNEPTTGALVEWSARTFSPAWFTTTPSQGAGFGSTVTVGGGPGVAVGPSGVGVEKPVREGVAVSVAPGVADGVRTGVRLGEGVTVTSGVSGVAVGVVVAVGAIVASPDDRTST